MAREFFSTMREALIAVRLDPDDRRLHKVDSMKGARVADIEKGSRDDAGWVKRFPDGLGGVAMNHRMGECVCWSEVRGKPLTRTEEVRLRQRAKEEREKHSIEEKKLYAKAAAIAAEILRSSRPAVEVGHTYLTRKHVHAVEPLGVIEVDAVRSIYQRMTGESASWLWSYKLKRPMSGSLLVVPCFLGGFTDRLSSVELIDGAGSKRCLKDSCMKDAFWIPDGLLDAVQSGSRIGIAEGIATALSISQVAFPCIAARSCENLKAAAKALRNRFPRAELIVCADRGNGELQARKAALAIGAGFMRPTFDPVLVAAFKEKTGGDEPTDFNDYFIATGEI